MKRYSAEQIAGVLKLQGLLIPPSAIVRELLESGRAKKTGKVRLLSDRLYETTERDIVICGEVILARGYLLCGSTVEEYAGGPERIDRLFEELVSLADKKIILLSPFLSLNFISDIRSVVESKRDKITIITNSPDSPIVDRVVHQKVVDMLRKAGYNVIISKRDFHAKIYLFDNQAAIVGSSNLSRQGFFRNYELGVLILGKECIKIRDWISTVNGVQRPTNC